MAWVSFKVTIHRTPGLSNRDSDWVKVINSGIKCRAIWLKREKKVTIMDLNNKNHCDCEKGMFSLFFSSFNWSPLIKLSFNQPYQLWLITSCGNIFPQWGILIPRFISANIQRDFLIWNPNWRSEVKTSGEGRCLMLQSSLYPLMISQHQSKPRSVKQEPLRTNDRSTLPSWSS